MRLNLFSAPPSVFKSNIVVAFRLPVVMLALLSPMVGCGPSQDDVMKRAAMRSRDPDPDEEEEEPSPVAPAPTPPAVMPSAVAQTSPVVGPATPGTPPSPSVAATAEPLASETKPTMEPISNRKPKEPLSDIDRRKRALSNIEKISAALLSRYKSSGSTPAAWMESSGGIKTLSWRVALLPELGYGDLYKQFNVEEPWDGPNNKKLLDMIPDEFVSPERFDTNTNYQLPVYGAYMFARPGFSFSGDTDAAVNTLMLLEVNDSHAVPWTQPADYGEARENVKRGLGGLREDGTFAVWANGMPVLLANSVGWMELDNALSAEAGDGQRAGQIHRSITIAEVTAPSVAADVPTVMPVEETTPSPVAPIIRDPVPEQLVLAVAGKKLRDLFSKKMAEANDDEKKLALANELLAEASRMTGDAASAFVLMNAGIKLASQGGNIETVLNGVDMKVGRFDVDAYELNVAVLSEFGVDNANRDASKVDGNVYLKRVLPTVFAALFDDDYTRGATIVRHAYKFSNQPRTEEIPKSLNLLRIQLASAQRSFETAKDSLASYRIDSNDSDAASTFGRFLVFVKGDWEGGLPLLARGGSESLRNLALADIRGADTASEMINLGDAWWDMSELAKTGNYRQASRDRATHWYQKAFANLPESLDKLHVKGRIEEAGDATKGSPLAVLRELARVANVDLTVSLASIADTKYRQQNPAVNDSE